MKHCITRDTKHKGNTDRLLMETKKNQICETTVDFLTYLEKRVFVCNTAKEQYSNSEFSVVRKLSQ